MNILLCGFHWTGCDALRRLLQAKHNVFVFTHEAPYHVPSLVEFCKKTNTPYSLDNISKSPLPFQPDCIASIYYRYLIKPNVIEACNRKIMNLHPSLLPKYRGCSSLTWAMIDQQVEAGFTYHIVDEGCDTGKILVQGRIPIMPFDTQGTLYQRVATKAMDSFDLALEMLVSNDAGREQIGDPSYFPRGCPHDGQINPLWPDEKIEAFIRAMIHPPYPPARYRERSIHSYEEYLDAVSQGQ